MSKATVRHVVHVIARLNVGGPAAILETLTADAAPGIRHTVLTGRVGRGEAEWSAVRGGSLTAAEIPGLTPSVNPAADVIAVRGVRRAIRRLQPDIVHTHTAKGGLVGRMAAFAEDVPSVHTFHGHVLNGYFPPTVTRAYVAVERRLARRTARLLSVGQRVGEELLAAGIGTRTQYRTVAPAVTPPDRRNRAAARETLGLSADEEVLLILGRLTRIKRVDRAIEVLRRLAQLDRPVTLLVAGGGELLQGLRHQAGDLGDRVRFLGWVADVAIPLAAADVMLLTSDNEGMPIGLIEAACVGLPVVACDVGSVEEVVVNGQTGRVVPPTVAHLTQATTQLLDDPDLRRRMGDLAVRRAADRFSAARLVADHTRIYHEVLTT